LHVQWCVRGIARPDSDWLNRLFSSAGLVCGWWRARPDGTLPAAEIQLRLDQLQLDLHQNAFYAVDPRFGPERVQDTTPFVSLSAGAVSRETLLHTNVAHRAQFVASEFATDYGRCDGVLVYCWVITSTVPAVPIVGVAEELRDLNSGRAYSAFQLEGEVAAKIEVPARQLYAYQPVRRIGLRYETGSAVFNPRFVSPDPLSEIRSFL